MDTTYPTFTHNNIGAFLVDQGFERVPFDRKMYSMENDQSLDYSFNFRVYERADFGRVLVCNTLHSYTLMNFDDIPQRIVKIAWFSQLGTNQRIRWNAREWGGLVELLNRGEVP